MNLFKFETDPKRALSLYNEQGYFVEPEAVTSEECDALIREAHQMAEGNTDLPPLVMPHRRSEIFFKQLRNQKIVSIMSKLLEADISGLQSQFFFSKPGTRGFAAHQDNFFVEARKDVFATVWSPLVDVNIENGCLYIYPGTHKEDTLPVINLPNDLDEGQDPNAFNEQCAIPEKYKKLDVTLSKGSALFIHGNLAHGSNNNRSNSNRYVSLNTYIVKGEAFRSGRTAKREEVALY